AAWKRASAMAGKRPIDGFIIWTTQHAEKHKTKNALFHFRADYPKPYSLSTELVHIEKRWRLKNGPLYPLRRRPPIRVQSLRHQGVAAPRNEAVCVNILGRPRPWRMQLGLKVRTAWQDF